MTGGIEAEVVRVTRFQVGQGPELGLVRFALLTTLGATQQVTVALTPTGANELATQLGDAATAANPDSSPGSRN